MPVTTGNLAQDTMQPPPVLPPSAQVEVQTADKTMNQGAEMPAVYHGGKAGGAAFLADKVLRGWMAGKHIAEQKQREKAANTMGSMQTVVDAAAQSYTAAVNNGDPKQIEKAYQGLKYA